MLIIILQLLGLLWFLSLLMFLGTMVLMDQDYRRERRVEESMAELWARNRYWDFEGEVQGDSNALHEIEEGK